MVSNTRIVMRNDYKGPGNRPLLRLSRRGGGGVFYVPGNQLGYPHAVQPGRAVPFLFNLQGVFGQAHRSAVTTPLPGAGVKGNPNFISFSENPYTPSPQPRNTSGVRNSWFARRKGQARCPHCGGNL